MSHADTAYTSIALGLHTDTTYFSDPVGLQMFHLLSDRSTHTGGHSLLSDGLQAANQLKTQHPVFYELLNTLPVPAHASGGDDARFSPMVQRPILEHDTFGKLVCIRYNNDDRAPVGRGPAWEGTVDLSSEGLGSAVDKVPAFYYGPLCPYLLNEWSGFVLTDCGGCSPSKMVGDDQQPSALLGIPYATRAAVQSASLALLTRCRGTLSLTCPQFLTTSASCMAEPASLDRE